MINQIAIGERIKAIRKGLGESQTEFGKHFVPTVSKAAVSKWESGDTKPNNRRLQRIAELGKVTTDFILNGDNTSVEDIQNLLNDFNTQDGLNLEKQNKLRSIRLDLNSQIDFKNRLKQGLEKQNIGKTEFIRKSIQDEMLELNSMNLTKPQAAALLSLLRSFKEINSHGSVASRKKLQKIIVNSGFIINGASEYNKDSMLKDVNDFFSEFS